MIRWGRCLGERCGGNCKLCAGYGLPYFCLRGWHQFISFGEINLVITYTRVLTLDRNKPNPVGSREQLLHIHKLHTPWRAVAAMFVLNGALFGIWASRIPRVVDRHDLSSGDLGVLLLLLAAGAITAFPLSGRFSDKIGAAKVTWGVAFGYTGSLFLIALSPSYGAVAVSLFIFGATHGAMDVAMNAWAGEVQRRMARPVMSSFHAMFSVGAGLGAGSGFVAASNGVDIAPHFFFAGTLIAAMTLVIGKIDWVSDAQNGTSSTPVFMLPKGPLFAVGIVAFCAALGEGGMADWSAIFLVLTTGASEAKAALGYAVFSTSMVAMRFLGDRVTHRLGAVTAARLAGITAAIGVLCAVVSGTYAMSLVGFALMGIGYALIIPLAFSRAANDPDLAPGVAIASVSTLGYGGMLLGPPLIGFVSQATSIRFAFLILAVLAILIVVLSNAVKQQGE